MSDSKDDVTPRRRGRPGGRPAGAARNEPGSQPQRLGAPIPGTPVDGTSSDAQPQPQPQPQQASPTAGAGPVTPDSSKKGAPGPGASKKRGATGDDSTSGDVSNDTSTSDSSRTPGGKKAPGRARGAASGAARSALGGGGLKGAASGAATGSADGQPKQGQRVGEDGQQKGPGAKESAKTIASETAKGATQGGAAAAATGGTSALAGAAKGLAKGTAKAVGRSPTGRKLFVAALVLFLLVPMMVPLVIGATVGGLVSALAEGEQENESTQAVEEDVVFDVDDINIRTFRDAVDGTDTPWQVLMALHQDASSGLSPAEDDGGVVDVVEPDDMSCPPTDLSAEDGLTPNALLVLRCGAGEFDEIDTWFGVGERSNNPDSDHPNGRAVDIMIPDWDGPVGNALGWTIARWAAANSDELGVKYVIFDAQIWTGGATWDTYSHPSGSSNPTVDHLDHVHVSVVDDGGQAATPGGAGSVGGGGSSGSAGSGRGPFGLTADADVSDEQADDTYMAGRYVAAALSAELNSSSKDADVTLASGTIRDEDEQLHLALPKDAQDDDAGDVEIPAPDDDDGDGSSGEPRSWYDDDLARDAADTKDVYVESIDKLPIDGMDEDTAEDVFTVARNWYMGLPGQVSGEVCVIDDGGESVGELQSTTLDGQAITLSSKQLGYASVVIGVADEKDLGEDASMIALMTALQESTLQNYANDGTHPGLTASEAATVRESLEIDNDAIGSDWDSVGIFQARPSMGWGSVKEIMDPEYTSGRFFDALEGVSGWESLEYGTAAQRVQISAFPDAYDTWEPVAADILANVSGAACAPSQGEVSADGWANPLPGSFISSPFDLARIHPITGQMTGHRGVDLAAPLGTEIVAAQDGVVIKKGGCASQGCSISDPDYWITGLFVAVDHGGVVTTYNHIKAGSPVKVGDEVKAGDHIANVGLTGGTTGPHLHFQVMPGEQEWVDPVPYLAERGIDLG